MAVKYRCTKCDRKFVEMGVAKLKAGKSCDQCHGEYLQQVGYDATAAAPRKKPALKRKRVRVAAEEEVAPTLASFDDNETVMPDLDTLTSANSGAALVEEFEPNDAEVEVVAADDEEEETEVATAEDEPAAIEDVVPLKVEVEEEEDDDEDD